jgi:hypothetical protein
MSVKCKTYFLLWAFLTVLTGIELLALASFHSIVSEYRYALPKQLFCNSAHLDLTRFWRVKEEKFTTESKYPSIRINRSIATKKTFVAIVHLHVEKDLCFLLARARMGTYEVTDFLVVLLGYAISGEPT